jgi:hypothetical protein
VKCIKFESPNIASSHITVGWAFIVRRTSHLCDVVTRDRYWTQRGGRPLERCYDAGARGIWPCAISQPEPSGVMLYLVGLVLELVKRRRLNCFW